MNTKLRSDEALPPAARHFEKNTLSVEALRLGAALPLAARYFVNLLRCNEN